MYFAIFAIVAFVVYLAWTSVLKGKLFMKASLYLYYVEKGDVIKEVHGDDAEILTIAYQMAIDKFSNMNNYKMSQNECFEILDYQVKRYGGRKNMLAQARQLSFPE